MLTVRNAAVKSRAEYAGNPVMSDRNCGRLSRNNAGKTYERMSGRKTMRLWQRPEIFVRVAVALTLVVSATVLAGWFLDIQSLRQLAPGQVSMKANTALGLLLCSIILSLAHVSETPARNVLRAILECIVLAVSILTLGQYLTGIELHLDELLIDASKDSVLTTSPGRMAPTTALGFILFSGALLVDHWRTGIARGISRTLSTLLLLLALTSLLGYAYDAPELYLGIDGVTAMSLPTAILFAALATGTVWLRANYGFAAMLLEKSVVGTYIRSLLPIVVASPLLVGAAVAVGYGRLYDGRFAIALTALGSVVAAAIVSAVSIVILRRADNALYVRDRALLATTTGVVITDHRQTDEPIVFINRAFTDITGYEMEDCFGRNCRFLNTGVNASEESLQGIRSCLRNDSGGQFELENRRKDGSSFWNRLSLAPVANYEGTITHFVGIIEDVTKRLEQQQQLVDALEETKRANKLRETFVRLVGHELRTPLNAALTWIRLMEVDNSQDTVNRGISVVAASIDSQSRLIDDLVDVSRFASAGVRLESETVDARHLVEETVEELRPTIEPELTLTLQITPGSYTAKVDPLRVKQIIRNLVSNAHRYTQAGGHISIHLSVVDDSLVMTVQDNGKGMTEEQIAHIFEPFWRVDHNLPGLGVGLAIVSALVAAHEGSIEVASDGEARGSTFTVRLPFDAAPSGRVSFHEGEPDDDTQ